MLFFILGYFYAFTSLTPRKIKIKKKKKKKNNLEISPCYNSVPKTWSYATLFLRCGAWWILFFILGQFLPFYPPNSPKNQNFKKMKKHLEIPSFYTSVPKIMIICYTLTEAWCVTDGNSWRDLWIWCIQRRLEELGRTAKIFLCS